MKPTLFITLCCLFITAITLSTPSKAVAQKQDTKKESAKPTELNLYGWHDQIPQDLLDAFSKEYNVKVRYDVYDTNEVLEAKLLAGNTGYDLVFPTAWPYAARQAASGLYEPLDRSQLKNWDQIGQSFFDRMEKADPGNKFVVPFTWGLVAIGYNPEMIPEDIPSEILESWALIYDPQILQKLSKRGITLLEDPLDVFTSFYLYQGLNPVETSPKLLRDMTAKLKELRPHYRRFGSSLVAEQLGNGELAVVMHWSGILSTARDKFAKLENGKRSLARIKIILPKEGTMMWIDCIAIPKDAPNIENAHRFIDFLLRPENAAKITNTVYTATTVTQAKAYLKPEIRDNKTIFPDDAYMKKVLLPEISSLQYQRRMSRALASIMTHKER